MRTIVKTPRIALLLCLGIVGLSVGTIAPTSALAHDSWLIADKSTANDGDVVWLSFVTGEVFPLGETATPAARVGQFVDRVDDKTTDITGYKPRDKGLSIRRPLAGPGLHVIGCALSPHLIEMKPDDFEKYLRAERAEGALAAFQRRQRHESSKAEPIVEEYTKFTKTIIEVSPADDDDGYALPLGHRLEIVPLSNPCRWKAGQTVRIKVLLDGYPWPDVNVSIGHEDRKAHDYVAQTRTDAKGTASITLSRPGHAFIKAQVIRQTDGLGKVKWESFWASLTFRVTGKIEVNRSLQTIRAFHGRIDPGAVAGYRIGRRALAELGLAAGAEELVAVQRAARLPQLTAMLDGIQAATGATMGRLNLRLEESDAKHVETVFANRATGRSVAFHLLPECLEIVRAPGGTEVEERALKLATMTDDELFEISPGREELRMANSGGGMTNDK